MYTENDYKNELYHHGIKGQKWGERNGPPYPLKPSAHSSAEKKASSNKTNKKKQTVDTKTGEIDPELATTALSVATMVAITATPFVMNAIAKKQNAKYYDSLYKERDIDTLSNAPKLSKPMSAEESMKVVNTDYPKPGTTENCVFCTTAMVLREKGYDVKASQSNTGFYDNVHKDWFEGAQLKKTKSKSARDLINTLESEGDGAYGNLLLTWQLGGGHSIFWKNENGKTNIYDAQNGKKLDTTDLQKNEYFHYADLSMTRYIRLDNCEPTDKLLGAVTRNN